MEKIINKLINEFTQGVDTYTHNGSTWLIFTESKQWVIELTDTKTLWYNYNFFKGIFSYTSMDVVENQSYITKWVEDNVINKELTYATLFRDARDRKQQFEDALQDGVIKTKGFKMRTDWSIEDTIENGVKRTYIGGGLREVSVDDTIEKGVKNTNYWGDKRILSVDDTIENGVKETIFAFVGGSTLAEDVLQNGVKETIECDWNIPKYVINEVVNDGVKYTFPNSEMGTSNDVEDTLKNGVKQTYSLGSLEVTEKEINNTLQSGVKETKQKKNALLILDTSGRELILESHLVIRDGVKETSHRQFLKTYDVKDTIQDGTEHDRWILDGCNDPVDVVLDNGVKITAPLKSREYTGDIDEVLGNGVRNSHPLQYRTKDMIDKVIAKGVIETYNDVYHHKDRIDGVIKNGVKETHREICEYKNTIDYIIQTGVKETKTPGDGDIVSTLEWLEENDTNSVPKMIDDVIENGEKINGTYAGGQRQSEKCKSVVEYGIKETINWSDSIDNCIDKVINEGTKNPTD
jgi:hypothetical protein